MQTKNSLRNFWWYEEKGCNCEGYNNESNYLFCDEPNSGLDPNTAILIDNLIQEITKEYQITTVINTHDMNSVMEIGEKIIFLERWRKKWEGTNKDIFNTDNKSISNFVYSLSCLRK